MKDMMDIIKGAEENRAPGRRSWIVTMAISLVAVGSGARVRASACLGGRSIGAVFEVELGLVQKRERVTPRLAIGIWMLDASVPVVVQ